MDATPANSQPAAEADVHHKIGLLTRQLHDSLNELGYADKLRGSMGELPDAQSRLSYIARLTGEAAEKVLNRVEQAKAQHDYIASETRRVVNALVADPVAAVAKGEIFNFLTDVERVTKEADTHLTEIMMAQDFQDLTGQVIKRMMDVIQEIERQLLMVLLENIPEQESRPKRENQSLLNGPQVDTSKAGVVASQDQVDDLLDSLGF